MKQAIVLLMKITLKSVPETNQYCAMNVKFLAQGNNVFDGDQTLA